MTACHIPSELTKLSKTWQNKPNRRYAQATKTSQVDEKYAYIAMSPLGELRDGSASDSDGLLLTRQAVFREFGHVFSADHVRFDGQYTEDYMFALSMQSA